jgi:cytolysin (calcineurin-like family phosphatase)
MIRKIASVVALIIAALPMVALTATMTSASTPSANDNPAKITIFNQGGYVADYQVSYSFNGQKRSLNTRQLRLGQKHTFKLPSNSLNVRVRGQVYTGLAWERKRIIFDQNFKSAPSEICFKTYGTTLAAKWDNRCNADF